MLIAMSKPTCEYLTKALGQETGISKTDCSLNRNIEGFYTDSSIDDKVDKFVTAARGEFVKTSGFDSLAVYSNYAHGDESPKAWYGERKLRKLAAIKKAWDEHELFSSHLPVPLEWNQIGPGSGV